MPERTHITASAACGQWEALLADALDGLLTASDEAVFSAHKQTCPSCAALYDEAQRGRQWLEFLAPEPEVPEDLLSRILAHTGPGHEAEPLTAGDGIANLPPVWQQMGFLGRMRRAAEPRLMMTAAMAFFSICLTLNMTGVRVSELRWSSLKPENLRGMMERRLTMASTPIVRYYDHIRLVYEVETRFREMRRGPQGEGVTGEPQNEQKKSPGPGTPGETSHRPSGNGGSLNTSPRQAANPPMNDILETSLTVEQGPAHSEPNSEQLTAEGGSAVERRERSTSWTA